MHFFLQKRQFPCDFCASAFTRKYHLKRHITRFHSSSRIVNICSLCGKTFFEVEQLNLHIRNSHPPSAQFFVVEQAFKRNFLTYRYTYDINIKTVEESLNKEIANKIVRTIRYETAKKHSIRVGLCLNANMSMIDAEGKCISEVSHFFRGKSFVVNNYTMKKIFSLVRRSFTEIENTIEEFADNGSNFVFNFPLCMDIQISKTKPLAGGAKTIKELTNSNFLCDVKSEKEKDDSCFLHAVAAGLYRHTLSKDDQKCAEKYEDLIKENFNIQNLTFPLHTDDVGQFCKQNKHLNIKINLLFQTFGQNGEQEVYPLKTNIGEGKNILNILLTSTEKSTYHYVLITDVNKYLRKTYLSKDGYKRSYKKDFFCLSCFNSFSTQKILDDHVANVCLNQDKREVPPQDWQNKVRFTKHERKFMQDLVAFVDFECTVPFTGNVCKVCDSTRCKCESSSNIKLQSHEPCAFTFIIVNHKDEVICEKKFFGQNAGEHFVEMLLEEEEKWIKDYLETSIPMEELTTEEKELYEKCTICHICEKPISNFEFKCKDHDHNTGKFLGAAHQVCNLHRQRQSLINVYIHNGSKYDFHLLIKALANPKVKNLNVLPFNSEQFRTISFNSFNLCDSLQFLKSSLDTLANDLYKTDHDYTILKQSNLFEQCDEEEKTYLLSLVKRGKSFFPYDFCTSTNKMRNTKVIPDRSAFFNRMKETELSVENYSHAKTVWNAFNCESLVDYTVLYCALDTFLLAEIFQSFRKEMMSFSGLDPAYYISLPGFAYHSMLKVTNCCIEVPTDISITKFFEKGIRGGLSYINTRYAEGSKNKDSDESSTHILYVDANK